MRCAISAASSALAESLASGRSDRPAARNRVTRGRFERHEQVCELDHHRIHADHSVQIILCTFRAHPTLRGRPPHNRPDASAHLTPCARGGIRTHTSFRTGGLRLHSHVRCVRLSPYALLTSTTVVRTVRLVRLGPPGAAESCAGSVQGYVLACPTACPTMAS